MYHGAMSAQPAAPTMAAAAVRERHELPIPHTWNLADIFPDWSAWEVGCAALDAGIRAFATRQGSLKSGPEALVAALQASDALGQLAYKVYYYASLHYDQDQRDNVGERSPAARAAPARALAAGDVVVQSRAARPAAPRCGNGWRRTRRSPSIASRSRISIGSRSTCSTRRASVSCRSRASSATPPTIPTRRCRRPTRSSRASN